MPSICKYEGSCKLEPYLNDDLCEFHKPKDKKRLHPVEFYNKICERINQGKFLFDGFIFPYDLNLSGLSFKSSSFKNAVFYENVTFTGSIFTGKLNFEGTIFHKGASFEGTTFENKVVIKKTNFSFETNFEINKTYFVSFKEAIFNSNLEIDNTNFGGGELSFKSTKFNGESVRIISCLFNIEKVDFTLSEFSSKNILLANNTFNCMKTIFIETKFLRGFVDFNTNNFWGGFVNFDDSEINCKFRMSLCDFSYGIHFNKVIFGDKASFSLYDLKLTKPKTNPIVIYFYRVKFNPFLTFFENIDFLGKYNIHFNEKVPLIAFRQCYLKDVYFTKCNMTLFSFYESAFFEESLFTSSIWPGVKDLSSIPYLYKDRLRISEEIYKTKLNEFLTSIESLNLMKTVRFPDSYLEIAELYLRFKSSADKANDYHLASHFYQNEFEMKRLHWKSFFINNNKINKFYETGYLLKSYLYWIYKFFTGYGEKPRISSWWFLFFTFLFAQFHLMNGIKTPIGSINYDYACSFPNLSKLLLNYFHCLVFSIYRILPMAYLPYKDGEYTLLDFGYLDLILYFCNTFVLVILLIYIGIGLKRHFRRF